MTNSIDLPLGVGVIVIKDGKILTGTRTDNGLICGPGGHIQMGEHPSESALRELQEEFNVKGNKLYQLGAIQDPEGKWKPSMVFLCTDYEGVPKADEEEMTAARFISIDELSQMSNLFPCFAASLVLLMDRLGICTDEVNKNTDAGNDKTLVLSDVKDRIKVENNDGGPGSGNWGHSSVKGVRGGSKGGGGKRNRQEENGRYTSEAKKSQEQYRQYKALKQAIGQRVSAEDMKSAVSKVREDIKRNNGVVTAEHIRQAGEATYGYVMSGYRDAANGVVHRLQNNWPNNAELFSEGACQKT